MGLRHRKPKSQEQQNLAQAQNDLLDTKEVLAGVITDNIEKDSTILDLKELVANLIVLTGGAV